MISGELRVVPDEALATELATLGDRPLLTIATICLDRAGAHTAVVTRPSQVPAFDRAAVEVASAWRFRPYVDRDVAMPVCGLAGAFRYGVTPTRDGGPPPADWYEALPPAERELPAPHLLRRRCPTRSEEPAPDPWRGDDADLPPPW